MGKMAGSPICHPIWRHILCTVLAAACALHPVAVIAQQIAAQSSDHDSGAFIVRIERSIDISDYLNFVLPGAAALLVIVAVFVYAIRKLLREAVGRKVVEARLREREAWSKSLLEAVPDATLILDQEGIISSINNRAELLFGAHRHHLIGEGIDLLVPNIQGESKAAYRQKFIATSAPRFMAAAMNLQGKKFDGTAFPVEINLSPIKATEKNLTAASIRDVTERRNAEQILAEQSEKMRLLSERLSRHLSPQVYDAIFSGASGANVQTERKKLTVFFSDIKDFTATTEEMEPEDMTFLLNDYMTKMSEIALEYGGTIDKYIGDAIMVFFGDPETKGIKQDALSAVNMAVAMQRRMVDLRAKWADMGFSYPFHIRCGVNTGYCNVGNFGSEQRIDYTIIGGQVNLAARLESICAPDGVTISYETYRHIRDEISAEPLEPIKVKGIKEPVRPFAVTGIFDGWDDTERYIRRDDIRGLRLWVDLMRQTDDQRRASIRELEEAIDILKNRNADNETARCLG